MKQFSVDALCPYPPVPAPTTVLCLRCMDGRVPHPEPGVYSLAIYGGMLPAYEASTDTPQKFQAAGPGGALSPPGTWPTGTSPTGTWPPAGRDSAVGTLFAAVRMGVRTVVVLGHSDCRAVAQVHGGNPNGVPDVDDLKNTAEAGQCAPAPQTPAVPEVDYDALSKQNVLLQMAHVRSYPFAQPEGPPPGVPAPPSGPQPAPTAAEHGGTPASGGASVRVHGAWYNLCSQQLEHYNETASAWQLAP
jgi:carbonic anhydrase